MSASLFQQRWCRDGSRSGICERALRFAIRDVDRRSCRKLTTLGGCPGIAVVTRAFQIEACFYSGHPALHPSGRCERRWLVAKAASIELHRSHDAKNFGALRVRIRETNLGSDSCIGHRCVVDGYLTHRHRSAVEIFNSCAESSTKDTRIPLFIKWT